MVSEEYLIETIESPISNNIEPELDFFQIALSNSYMNLSVGRERGCDILYEEHHYMMPATSNIIHFWLLLPVTLTEYWFRIKFHLLFYRWLGKNLGKQWAYWHWIR